MKNINELYKCNFDIMLKDIKIDSRLVEKDDLFVCTKGINTDRHDYIDEAIKNGASCIITNKDVKSSIPYIKVKDTNEELPILSKKFYEYKDTLKLIGITGTDGKTTTATIIKELLGIDAGYLGTNGVIFNNKEVTLNNTTPSANIIYKYLGLLEQEKIKYASMEVSSEALLWGRVDSLSFDIAVMTNITEDHLNVHKTLDNYIKTKKKLFKMAKVAILNRDDIHFQELSDNCKNIFTYGKDLASDLIILDYDLGDDKTEIKYKYLDNIYLVTSPLVGEFNVYNLSAGILTLLSMDIKMEDIISNIPNIKTPKGRCEFLDFKQDYKICLDYAHTSNGLFNILTYLNKVKVGKIITVTGSAGGREKEKRKEMGRVVQVLSDLVIYTMDDPRNESVTDIINDLIDSSINNYKVIEDRPSAIKEALSIAKAGDIVLIAGKGRDKYMAIGHSYIDYSDYEEIKKYFETYD